MLTGANAAGRSGAHEQIVRGWIKAGVRKAGKPGTRTGYHITRTDEDFLRRRPLTGVIAGQLLRGASASGDS